MSNPEASSQACLVIFIPAFIAFYATTRIRNQVMRILKANSLINHTINTTVYRKWWQFWKPKSWKIRVPDRRETSDEFEEENTEVGAGKLYRALEQSMKK